MFKFNGRGPNSWPACHSFICSNFARAISKRAKSIQCVNWRGCSKRKKRYINFIYSSNFNNRSKDQCRIGKRRHCPCCCRRRHLDINRQAILGIKPGLGKYCEGQSRINSNQFKAGRKIKYSRQGCGGFRASEIAIKQFRLVNKRLCFQCNRWRL